MEEDVLSDVVPSNIVSRQQSEGVESEYADEVLSEQDELQSEEEDDNRVRRQGALDTLHSYAFPQGEGSSAASPQKPGQVQASADRAQKKQKRKAEEGKLQVKRQEMDKAKASLVVLYMVRYSPTQCRSQMLLNVIRICLDKRNYSNISLISRFVCENWNDARVRLMVDGRQKARDPEYAAMLDAQPKPKGRGRKKAV